MSKNIRWTTDDLKKKGLAQNASGDYVPVSSLVQKGKVEKIEPGKPLVERAGEALADIDEANRKIRAEINKLPQREYEKMVMQVPQVPVPLRDVVKDYLADPERQHKDLELATGFAMMVKKQMAAGIDPVDAITQPIRTYIKDDKLLQELIEVSRFYNCKILSEKRTIKIKPLTQNRAWKGRRFKSDQYKQYALAVGLLLPNDLVIPAGPLRVYYEFGMSVNSDFDNPCKMFTDILQAKYHFNDKNIMEANIKKVVVKKGEEYIKFSIDSL